MKFSYTSLSNFLRCPKLYYYLYVEKKRIPDTIPLMFGSVVHKSIKICYDYVLSKSELLKVFKREWLIRTKSSPLNISETEYISKIKEGQYMLGRFYDKHVKNVPAPKATEIKFDNVKLGKHELTGIIDEISHDDVVIDFKTSHYIPNNFELSLDLQFTFYSIAFRQMFNKDELGLSLFNLRTCKNYNTKRSEADFNVLENILNSVSNIIENGLFYRQLGKQCYTCPFVVECLNKVTKQTSSWNKMNEYDDTYVGIS